MKERLGAMRWGPVKGKDGGIQYKWLHPKQKQQGLILAKRKRLNKKK